MGWQTDYQARGSLWAGASYLLPEIPENALILETGCGNGKTLRSLGQNAVGIDISSAAVQLAGSSALVGDVRSLPFNDSVFDIIFCWHVLGHLSFSERKTAAEEMLRVLKPEGVLYFKDFSRNDFRYGKGTEIEPSSFLRGDGIVTHYFEPEELISLFGPSDLSTVSWNLRIKGVNNRREEILLSHKKTNSE
ncbi:Methyltransferase type 11 [Methanocorpusculum labreanum Z]|uniref:Methyltransferase type 11 n=1 Tax=Methanocorpusculum labreanum (strain ATCC 43576 / DSM 4855 / Z) TaxID=410358 RepID=A2STB7_METLZ|nr:class I SAM-dependent methyltransferase [Methanocorpusculum labreanum]ABN07573.1 Methyltransferase type 11 [Methanocorpusculum labreanum Z]